MLVVTGEPCLMCAKLLHHAGVGEVVVVRGGYAGGTDGTDYLVQHGVTVTYREGPRDPRMSSTEEPYEFT
jgi:dCMP deaminase